MNITLTFKEPGYIEHPYWPEQYRKIEIDKKSGINRARTEANRRKALEAYLVEVGMTLDQYKELCAMAARPFHSNGSGHIYIPQEKILSCLVNANDVAPSKMRIQNLRVAVSASNFKTTKAAPDGVWERFAVVNMGSGAKASNQRGHRANAYIKDFDAVGTIECVEEMVDPKAVVELLKFAGRVVGIGAARKMGWGRFTLSVGRPSKHRGLSHPLFALAFVPADASAIANANASA